MTNSEISKILHQEPQLSLFGFSRGDNQKEREEIFHHIKELDACCDWLEPMRKNKHVNRRRSSYTYKHMVEVETGLYIPNGVFIVAAIHRGFKFERTIRGTNAIFNMAEIPIRTWMNAHPNVCLA